MNCSIEGCGAKVVCRGLCDKHYTRFKRHGDPTVALRDKSRPCAVDGCTSKRVYRQYCSMHQRRIELYGDPLKRIKNAPGVGWITTAGYIGSQIDGVRKFEHVRIAEKALGRPLPAGVEVHHVNEIKHDNRPENLVICPDKAYHRLLHARTRAYEACGNANWRCCAYCKQWDAPENMQVSSHQYVAKHRACAQKYAAERKMKRELIS